MRLFVLGATGRTGSQAIDLALARDHDVTAFVRSPQKLRPAPRLSIVQGDPHDVRSMKSALIDHDAVLFALVSPAREALRPSTLLTDLAASTVEAMHCAHVSRIALVSAAVLFPGSELRLRFFRWLLRHHARDLGGMERAVQESELSWTIARPPRLVKRQDAEYRAVPDALPSGSFTASFRSVAAFMLDSIERGSWQRQIVGVAR